MQTPLNPRGVNIYGYGTGMAIACVTVAVALFTGYKYAEYTTPEPCIANLAHTTYPWIAKIEQGMLDEVIEYDEDSDLYGGGIKTSEDLAYRLVEMSQDSEYPSEIYINPITKRKFFIPALCRYEVDGLGDPVLYRK